MDINLLKSKVYFDMFLGRFIWIQGRNKGRFAGGYDKEGYWMIKLNDKYWFAHRLAWLYVYGKLPDTILDHINKNKSDNRIENLRECSLRQNRYNSKLNKNNTSGYRGIHFSKKAKKWKAAIHKGNKYILVGYFTTLEEAVLKYNERIKLELDIINYINI